MRTLVAVLVMAAGLAGGVQAQSSSSVGVEAEVQSSEVGTEETVTFTLRVHNVSLSDINIPDVPSATNLAPQQSSPSTQRNLSFGDGQLERSLVFEWRYRPLRVGKASIHPLEVAVQGETYTTDEIRIQVVPQDQRPSSRSRRTSPAADETGATDGMTFDERDLFIRATATDEEAYQNEQITVEYRLFYRPGVRLRHSRLADAWDAAGFWREELDVPSRPTPRPRRVYGERYESILLKRVVLFPTRPGSLRVDPLRIETEAQKAQRMNGREGAMLRSRYEQVTIASDALPVRVRSLPPSPPAAFQGAVGQFSLRTRVGADSVHVGEAVQLTATLEGTGNLATLSPPQIELPEDVEAYEPEVQTDIRRGGDKIRGTKTFTFTLVPGSNGSYTVPPVTFAYFNPETESYETLQSDPATLHVTGDDLPRARSQTGEGLPVGDITGLADADAQWVRTTASPLYRQPWVYVVLLLPVVLAVGALFYRRRRQAAAASAPSDQDEALQRAQDYLGEAHRCIREGSVSAFYRAVERAVLAFLRLRLGLARTASGLSRGEIDRHLTRHEVPKDCHEELFELLDACEQAQFTPARPSYDSMQAALDHTQSLLLRLDTALPPQESDE